MVLVLYDTGVRDWEFLMLSVPPVVVGLTICRDFLRDPASGNYSVIRSFTGLPIEAFPGSGEPFCVFGIFTDAVGEAEAELVIDWFSDESVGEYAKSRGRVRFPDKLRLVECKFNFHHFPFPGPGEFLFTLYLDGVWMAQRSLRVYAKGETT